MKVKLVKDRHAGEQLVVKTGKGENLEYAQAETLKGASCASLLPFTYERQRLGVSLVYNMVDTVPLETLLGAKLSRSQFKGMLQYLVDAFEVCERLSLDPAHLDFDEKHVRLTVEEDRMAFAYFPLSGLQGDRPTVKDLLRFIAEKAHFVCAEDHAVAHALLDHLERQTVFSVVEFKEFLNSDLFGENTAADDAQKRVSRKDASAHHVVDLVQLQTGSQSLREKRQSQTLAQQVVSEVAETAVHTEQPDFADHVEAAETAVHTDTSTHTETAVHTDTSTHAETAVHTDASVQTDTSTYAEQPDFAEYSEITDASTHTEASAHAEQPDFMKRAGCYIVRLSDQTRFFVADGQEALMGRSKDCAIRITGNPGLSRKHASVVGKADGCLVTDLGSTNGTFVDERRLAPNQAALVAPGSTFLLAKERFKVEASES